MFVDICDGEDVLGSLPRNAVAGVGEVAEEPSGENGASFAGSSGRSFFSCRNRLATVERVLPGVFASIPPRKPTAPANLDESCLLQWELSGGRWNPAHDSNVGSSAEESWIGCGIHSLRCVFSQS